MSARFVAPDESVAVDLADPALAAMLELCRQSGRLETGGVLLGHYGEHGDRVLITKVTGPPRDSRRFPAAFIRGIQGLTARLGREWLAGIYYVGEWHFHPFASAAPSDPDIRQTKRFAVDPHLVCPRPVLIIVGGNPDDIATVTAGVMDEGSVRHLEPVAN